MRDSLDDDLNWKLPGGKGYSYSGGSGRLKRTVIKLRDLAAKAARHRSRFCFGKHSVLELLKDGYSMIAGSGMFMIRAWAA